MRLSTKHLATRVGGPLPVHRDTTKAPRITTEVGTWLYNRESMEEFQRWCRMHQVRAYGNIKMASTLHFARCLRAAKVLYPGQAIITCPYSACYNFLVAAKEMYDVGSSCAFPLQLNWMNYNSRLPFLKSSCTFELAMAGWMVRIASLEDSPLTPYIKYLLEDTRGRDGVATGISREREEENGLIDHYFSEMATDACEDPEVFLERMFLSLACVHLRTQPIEPEAIEAYIPGTNFFKLKASDMYVPTLMPLIDTVVQREDGCHNTVVEYFPFKDAETLRAQCAELQIPFTKTSKDPAVVAERPTSAGIEQIVHTERGLMNAQLLKGGGFFALRALELIEKGDVLCVRRYPSDGDMSTAKMNAQVLEANRLLTHDN